MLIEWLCWNLLWYLALKSFRKNCFLTTRNSCSQLKTPVVYTNLIQLNGLRTFPFFALHPAELEPDFEMRGPKKAGKGEIYGCFWVKRRFFRDSCLTGLILKLIFFFEKNILQRIKPPARHLLTHPKQTSSPWTTLWHINYYSGTSTKQFKELI